MIIKMNLDPGDNHTMSASQVLLNEPGILLVFRRLTLRYIVSLQHGWHLCP